MTGEGLALLAALAYGLAGVAIAKGKATAQGDNGVFLSVAVTAAVSGALWSGWGQVAVSTLATHDAIAPIVIFIAAGLFSVVLGRRTMYRATERIGPVAASLLRRLTPVFALPLGVIFLGEIPGARTMLGAALVIVAVLMYLGRPRWNRQDRNLDGCLLGVGSAAFYAVSYALRSDGLDRLPDAAPGTLIGAGAGMVWMLTAAAFQRDLRSLVTDCGPWHWLTALALSAGQILQFFALESASVVVVATLGSLEVFFAALLGAALIGGSAVQARRVALPAGVAIAGTALVVW